MRLHCRPSISFCEHALYFSGFDNVLEYLISPPGSSLAFVASIMEWKMIDPKVKNTYP